MELKRRDFIKGAALASLSAFALGATGCAAGGSQEKAAQAADSDERSISEVRDCEIVVVGAGMSGLSAAVQASELSNSVMVLEASGEVGGAGGGVEGIFAVDSPLQKEKGIEIDRVSLLTSELRKAGYVVSGLMWKELISNSADNIQWLLDDGVEFSGVVDGYTPTGEVPTFHWFKDGHARDGYVMQMKEKAISNGAEFVFNTAAKELIMENDRVSGLYALKNDDTFVQINAKAVVLCAGGFTGDEGLLCDQTNLSPGEVAQASIESAQTMFRVGDGVKMAEACGAQRYPLTCIEGSVIPEGFPCGTSAQTHTLMITDKLNFRVVRNPLTQANYRTVWVQEDGLRFANEAVRAEIADEIMYAPRKFVKEQYEIFDQDYVDAHYGSDPDMAEAFDALLRDYPDCFTVADSIEELAESKGLDPKTLRSTIDAYNGFCESGVDEEFGKPAEFLAPISKKPFYIFKVAVMSNATIGGICVGHDFQALTPKKEAIQGLYVAGVDGCMLYNCTYTIGIPGSACANSINSGRTAAKHAFGYLGDM